MTTLALSRTHRSAERSFYTGLTVLMLMAVLIGFSRTFFLKPWFPGSAHLLPPEPFFYYIHGVCFTAWFLLLIVQSVLVANREMHLHRRLGWCGAGLAVMVVAAGTVGSLIAAGRPGGFIGVPVPPLRFLAVPLGDIALFAIFISLAIAWRRDTQSHKRLMLLATIGLLDGAVVRWPLGDMTQGVIGSLFTLTDLCVDLFIVPIVVWDVVSRGRVHRVTLAGGLAIIASQPLRVALSNTDGWVSFAGWAVGLLGK